jgi:pyruvate/2-oxoacid:ferredoxin oxidoreductase alpha subunit
LSGGGIGWLRRLWRLADAGAARAPGADAVLPVQEVLGILEAQICEGVAYHPAPSPSAARAVLRDPAGRPARNAFGLPIQEEAATGASGSVAVATGMVLAGLRATAFLEGDELAGAHGALRAAARRLAPLVLHTANGEGGHAGYHAVAGSGLFQVLPSSGQEALDLSLVARWLAERALVPGLVASDGLAVERACLPDDDTVRAYLGRPEEPIASPTDAQQILFGTERPRLLRWFDADRPVATGEIRGVRDEARARAGARLFFGDHVAELARRGMAELSELTGRPLSFVRAERLEDAELVLVAQGALVETARAAADHVRRTRGFKVGVVGVTWLRPLPVGELTEALAGRRRVAVVEAVDEPEAAAGSRRPAPERAWSRSGWLPCASSCAGASARRACAWTASRSRGRPGFRAATPCSRRSRTATPSSGAAACQRRSRSRRTRRGGARSGSWAARRSSLRTR